MAQGANGRVGLGLGLQIVMILVTAVSSSILSAVTMRDQAKLEVKTEILEAVRREQGQYLLQVDFQRWLVTNERQYQQILRAVSRIEDRLK